MNQAALDKTYMLCAEAHALLSKATRAKVGALIVTPSGALLGGVNGTPSGYDNTCEIDNVTLDHVLHAEQSAILAAARQGVSLLDSTVYVTLLPCSRCSAMLAQVKIKRLVYKDDYRDSGGIEMLLDLGIEVEKYQWTQEI